MREWINKKWVQAVLVLTVLLIWGYNMYSIADIATGTAEERKPAMTFGVNINDLSMPEIKEYTYKADSKDPFQPKLTRRPSVNQVKSKNTQPEPKQKKSPPKLSLNGIMEEMALIQNENRELFFVTAGDMVEGASVRRIKKNAVVLVFEGDEFTLKVNNY